MVGAQIISSSATSFVVIVTLGLRLVDDTLNRYETFARKWIDQLKGSLVGIRDAIESIDRYSYPTPHIGIRGIKQHLEDVNREMSRLVEHGRFFFTKLYPSKTMNRIRDNGKTIENYIKLAEELRNEFIKGTGYGDISLKKLLEVRSEEILP